MKTDILIIGGGLSGLQLSALLAERGEDFCLLEGRDRFGGRILSETYQAGRYDLGPAWFWAGQPRIEALARQFGLSHFEQYADGILTFEDETGRVQRGRGFASMRGSYRLEGGLGTLIEALVSSLPQDRLHLSHHVRQLRFCDDMIEVTCKGGEQISARRVVLALPPRVAAELSYTPALPAATIGSMQDIATWMAGQAKALALYETPFWRLSGLSGDAMSRHGPMAEIHDASPHQGGPFALFGFIGLPPAARRDEKILRHAILDQFGRLFGEEATNPLQLFVKDWAFDEFTSTAWDQQPLYTHPHYGRPAALSDIWDNSLIFAGTEMASRFGGYLEGALEAAEDVAAMLAIKRGRVP